MGGAALIAGVAGGTALLGAKASKSAANSVSDANRYASDIEMEMYQQSKKTLAPWVKQGVWASNQLKKYIENPSAFKATPDYRFQLNRGMQGIQRAEAAGGGLRSGSHLKAAGEYAQGLAASEYDNFLTRFYNISGQGQAAAAGQAQNAIQTGNQVGANAIAAGQATAAGQLGSANSLINGINYGAGQLLDYYNYNKVSNPVTVNSLNYGGSLSTPYYDYGATLKVPQIGNSLYY